MRAMAMMKLAVSPPNPRRKVCTSPRRPPCSAANSAIGSPRAITAGTALDAGKFLHRLARGAETRDRLGHLRLRLFDLPRHGQHLMGLPAGDDHDAVRVTDDDIAGMHEHAAADHRLVDGHGDV